MCEQYVCVFDKCTFLLLNCFISPLIFCKYVEENYFLLNVTGLLYVKN